MAELARNVRQPIWSGVQDIAGLWLSAHWLSAAERNRRLFAVWRTGSKAYRFEDGDLLRFPAPLTLRCDQQPGLALCLLSGGQLAAAPLTAREAAVAAGADVLLVDGAHVLGLRLVDAQVLDLSLALDIGDYALHDTYDCSAAVKPVGVGELQGKDLRTLLGDAIPPPAAEREEFLREAAARQGGKSTDEPVGQRLRGIAMRMLGGVAGLLASASGGGGGAGRPGGKGKPRPGAIPGRTPSILPQSWRNRLARFANATRLSRVFGWRHGAYMRKLLDLFEDGDIQEALRRALPLGGDPGHDLGQSFGTPGRRDHLGLSEGVGYSSSLDFGDDLREHLRALYRRTFETLDRAGRIDEAVFVLAELLNARQEALDYLEKHGRAAQAADLALRWDMPGAMIVRLLLVAGDWDRAIQVARRDNEFAAVVTALGKTRPELVAKLRLAWGESLADRGDWLAAVEAIWPVPQARHIAAQWLLSAEQAGEELSARALVRRAALLPDTIAQYEDKLQAMLADPDAAPARAAMASALAEASEATPALQALAAAVLPEVAADRAAGRNELGKNALNKLVERANDAFLRADLPDWKLPASTNGPELWRRADALAPAVPAAGLLAVHDAVALTDDRYLVALGEGGAVVVDRHGRTTQRYAVPCYRLVIADSRRVALAIAPREEFSRIVRLDLVNHAIADLGALRLSSCADRFDGIAWSVVADNRILVIDTAKSLQDVLWHVGDLPGQIILSRFDAQRELHLLHTRDEKLQLWTYLLPGRRLLSRTDIELDPDPDATMRLHSSGVVETRYDTATDEVRASYSAGGRKHAMRIALEPGNTPGLPQVFTPGDGLLMAVPVGRGARLALFGTSQDEAVLRMHWPDAPSFGSRAQDGHLLFFDGQGRLLDVPTDGRPPRSITLR